MSESPPSDHGAGEQDTRAIHVDDGRGMLIGDQGTQSNRFTHVTGNRFTQITADGDALVAGRDMHIKELHIHLGDADRNVPEGLQKIDPDGTLVGADALAHPQRAPLEWAGRPVSAITVDGRIALWGATGSGKTCFVTALNAAVARAQRSWTLVGVDVESSEFLSRATAMLIQHREFPPATSSCAMYTWVLSTDVDIRVRRLWKTEIRRIPLRFQLDIMDARGGSFSYMDDDSVIDYLLSCDGLIFLYDASYHNGGYGDSYEYFHNVMGALEQRFQLAHDFNGGRIPHRLAVCVSKFDEPGVLRVAEQGGYLVIDKRDELGVPRVPDDRAAQFFQELCRASSGGGATIIDHSIRRYFRPDRVRYYASSSIGFHIDNGMRVDMGDCYNINKDTYKIRGEIRPMNVLEPLLWLYQPVDGC